MPPLELPERTEIVRAFGELFEGRLPGSPRVLIHYLGEHLEARVLLTEKDLARIDRSQLGKRIEGFLAGQPQCRAITVPSEIAP